jgi:hypothetical protein
VSRQYPLDLPEIPEDERRSLERRSWLREDGLALRLARVTASGLLAWLDWRRAHRDLSQFLSALVLLFLGMSLVGTAGIVDEYLHRGVETGVEGDAVVQPAGKELATNVDLSTYSSDFLVQAVDAISEAGFTYVRQPFSWASIEARRGEPDFSAYDLAVEELGRRQIRVVAVISDVPFWAMVEDRTTASSVPIVDLEALSAFSQELTGRYVDTVAYVQVWDRPNAATATPIGAIAPSTFTRMLASAANGARTGNPEVRIISPELAVSSDIESLPSDLAYLEALYAHGAQSFVDIVGIALDGTHYSPDDRQVAEGRHNFSRAVLFRELMVDHGDEERPIWATSYGWSVSDTVDRETQAEFVQRGMERSWAEWPWMGLMLQWSFLADASSPDLGYAMVVLPDGSPTPLYDRLVSAEIQHQADIAHTGFAPMDSAAMVSVGNWQDQHLEGRTFKTTGELGASFTFTFSGTGVVAYMRSGTQTGLIQIELDGEVIPGGAEANADWWDYSWYQTRDLPFTLLSGLEDREHVLTITLMDEGELTLGGMVVAREAPFTWPIMLMAAASFLALFLAMRSFIYLVGVRAGHLVRRGTMRDPALPTMPNWRPSRRI